MRALLVGQATEVSSAITWKRFADWMGNKSGWRKHSKALPIGQRRKASGRSRPLFQSSRKVSPATLRRFPASSPPACLLLPASEWTGSRGHLPLQGRKLHDSGDTTPFTLVSPVWPQPVLSERASAEATRDWGYCDPREKTKPSTCAGWTCTQES